MTTKRFHFVFDRFTRSMWFRPSLYALAAPAAVAVGPTLSPLVPTTHAERLAGGAVEGLLEILASSMLAVAIFSLGTMVQAFQALASSATPRARPLLAEDRTAQNAIATFIGAFLFSVLGLVGLGLELFDAGGRLVLFGLAIALVVAVVATLIGWLRHLVEMGGVGEAIERVEAASTRAFGALAEAPHFGGVPAVDVVATQAVTSGRFGFVQHVDTDALGAWTEAQSRNLVLEARPGAWVHPESPLVRSDGELDTQAQDDLRSAFVIGRQRSFDVDARFGLVVLAEIAARALSPAVNDPGTAIDVLSASTRVLGEWRRQARARDPDVRYRRLAVVPITIDDLLIDAFEPIARLGRAEPALMRRLEASLGALERVDEAAFREPCRRFRTRFLSHSKAAPPAGSDDPALGAGR